MYSKIAALASARVLKRHWWTFEQVALKRLSEGRNLGDQNQKDYVSIVKSH
jgi:hypothetical protein